MRPTAPYTFAELNAVFRYDPETGFIHWRVGARAGTRAGTGSNRYWRVSYKGVNMQAHRVAWLLMTRRWPRREVDHADLDKRNNRWSNLRLATPTQQVANRVLPLGKHGFKGVGKNYNRWRADIGDTPRQYLGTHATAEDAARAYDRAAVARWGPFARLNFPQEHQHA